MTCGIPIRNHGDSISFRERVESYHRIIKNY